METFYKATRVDGFDFYSGTIDYASHLESGESLPLKDGTLPECCSPGVYHASTSAADTLIGGSWPCRLFLVEGEVVASRGNKRGFLTLKVIQELDSWLALGPNGKDVVKLIDSCSNLDKDKILAIYAAIYAARDEAWYTAWCAARDAVRNAARDAARNAARDAAMNAAMDAAWYAARDAVMDAARDAAVDAAVDAAWYAAWALVVRDLISKDHFAILTSPWVSVMGEI